MTSANGKLTLNPDPRIQPMQKPDRKIVDLLRKWLAMHPDTGPTAAYLTAGADRDALRTAEAWGPFLIAALLEGGHLEPHGNPLDALNALCGYEPEVIREDEDETEA